MKHGRCMLVIFSALVFLAAPGWATQTLVLYENFSGALTDNWTPGRATNLGNPHSLTIDEGRLKWVQSYDYIESKLTFGNDVMVQFEYSADAASFQWADFWVELTALTEADPAHHTAGIYRSQYGGQNYHAINVGRAPSVTDSTVADPVLGPPHLITMEPGSPREGTVTFTYASGSVRMSFENAEAEVIHTAWVPTGSFAETRVRIWGMGTAGGPRYIHNVKIYAPSGTAEAGPCKPRVVVVPLCE